MNPKAYEYMTGEVVSLTNLTTAQFRAGLRIGMYGYIRQSLPDVVGSPYVVAVNGERHIFMANDLRPHRMNPPKEYIAKPMFRVILKWDTRHSTSLLVNAPTKTNAMKKVLASIPTRFWSLFTIDAERV